MKHELFAYSNYPEWGRKKLNDLFWDDETGILYVGKLFDNSHISFDIYSSLEKLNLAVVFPKYSKDKCQVFYYLNPEKENSKRRTYIEMKDIKDCVIDESLLDMDNFSIWNGIVFERNSARFSLNGKTPEVLDIRETEPFIKNMIEKFKYAVFHINCFMNAFGTKTVFVGGTDDNIIGNDYVGEIPDLKEIFVCDADPNEFWPYMEVDIMKRKTISVYAIGKNKNEDFSNWETFAKNDYDFKLMADAYYEADRTGKITKDVRNE